jgi:hypothetical protein
MLMVSNAPWGSSPFLEFSGNQKEIGKLNHDRYGCQSNRIHCAEDERTTIKAEGEDGHPHGTSNLPS